MATTPNMLLPVPDDHTDADTWGVALASVFGVSGGGIDAHDHSTGKGVLVPSAGIGINADLSFASFALTTAKAIAFNQTTTASVSGYASALFVNSADHNLYFRNSSGANVQITAGSTINVSLVGGIGGDYASVSALLSYVDASRDYLFQQEGSPRPWAGIETGDIKLYEKAASISNAITLKSPSGLAAGYTVTMPAAVPASTLPVQMSSAGVLTASRTIVAPLLFTTDDTYVIPALMSQCPGGTAARYNPGDSWNLGTSTDYIEYPICLPVGYQITSWSLAAYKGTNNTKTLTAQLFDVTGSGVSESDTGLGASQSSAANAPGDIALAQSGLTQTLAVGHRCIVRAVGSGTAGDYFGALTITAKRVS